VLLSPVNVEEAVCRELLAGVPRLLRLFRHVRSIFKSTRHRTAGR